ncbi:MAG: hypothetical protein E7530_08140 [Ruminococcaceae bacterium]|nr:hypothetical protein [Oscillospiraceae bacterium]
MKSSFYKNLQDNFVMIRFLHSQDFIDKVKYDSTILSIKESRKKINKHSAPSERKILLYCIDTLFEILNEGDKKKIFDFADAIHNIPEIYMQKRNLYSFRKELKAFQRKYGKHYFTFINEVKPHFTKKGPKNKWIYFLPSSDDDFKKLHPIGYKLLCAIGFTALFLPQIIYMVYVLAINPAPDEWTIMLGYAGTFIVGIGLFNIVAAWIHQYFGHLLTVVCLLGGAAVTGFSMYLLYT